MPPKNTHLMVRMTEQDRDGLKSAAKYLGESASEFVRVAVRERMEAARIKWHRDRDIDQARVANPDAVIP
jgi:uncharacterized protein (DUF1778 family)